MHRALSTSKANFPGIFPLFILVFSVFLPTVSHALTPIARWDVLPHQRIENDETFNIGVVAFSKAGISRVKFTVSGQGYSGPNPLYSTSMTYNSRTDVYEYWVPLKGSGFATDGVFTVQATVYGQDGGRRNLGALPLVVNATGRLPQPRAWVSKTGNNSTGAVNTRSRPFLTVGGAVKAIQSVTGGKSDGGIIYLLNGTYNLGDGRVNTVNEWLTITRDTKAVKEKTIINSSGSVRITKLLKVDGVTLKSKGSGQRVFTSGAPINLWVNDSRIIGSGRWVSNSNPVHHTDGSYYSTNNYVYDVDYGFRKAGIVRGVDLKKIGNDAFENTPFIVNCTLDDLDNGPTGWHSDAYQVYTTRVSPAKNRIIYNYKATNLHYQGIFLRSDGGTSTDNAFVNVFIEMREPADKNESGQYSFMALSINQSWDHLLIWNSTFLNGHSPVTASLTNSSFIGNLFYQYVDNFPTTPIGNPVVTYAQNGNAGKNEFLYNHFMYVFGETSACTPNTRFISNSWPCPHRRAKIPDSHAAGSATTGDGVIDMTDPSSNGFGMPVAGSVLIDRIPFPTVPADIFGNPRTGNPDVGAIEEGVSSAPDPDPDPDPAKRVPLIPSYLLLLLER